ncbi:hypothetical protein AB7M17_004407 [Bradyrhizobium sp. USDA 377]
MERLSSLAAAAGGGVTAGTREKCESSALVKNDKCAAFTTSENRMPICADRRARQYSINIERLLHYSMGRPRGFGPPRKRRIERSDLLFRQHEIARGRVFAGMFRRRRFRNCEHRSCTGEEAQRDLTRCHASCFRNAREHGAALAVARWKIIVTERRIGDDSNAVLLAPRDHRMLDGAFLEMIEHLIAGDASFA